MIYVKKYMNKYIFRRDFTRFNFGLTLFQIFLMIMCFIIKREKKEEARKEQLWSSLQM